MALILQKLLHSENQQPDETNQNNNGIKKIPGYTLQEDPNLQGKHSQK
jgi:hypothetical protein